VENVPQHLRRKIRCFVYGKRSDVQRQQPDVKSRRTAEESRTNPKYVIIQNLSILDLH